MFGEDGKHMDISQKPELSRGCVEFVAPSDYMVRPPMPPVYVFLIEATFASVSSGISSSCRYCISILLLIF